MCTNFILNAKDGSFVVGRSMEFGNNLKTGFYVHRRGDALNTSEFASKGFSELTRGKTWNAKYGYLGLNSHHFPGVVDGMNEKGLTVGALWLPGTVYQHVTNPTHAIPAPLLCDWALANFATVQEVIDALPDHQFWLPEKLTQKLPLHFPITDASGNAIVIEFQGGEQRIYQNLVGVCTNDPWYPWQVSNLGNYTNVTANDSPSITIGKLTIKQTGHGSGLKSLPGDPTPPSRFVRAAILKQLANPAADGRSACILATHILNDVDIAIGCVRDGDQQDYTQWAVVKDLTQRVFAVRTYDSMMYRAFDLKEIDFATIKSHSLPIPAVSDMKFMKLQESVVAE